MTTSAPARIKVFWQPGCSSCLRTKEFLTKQGIDFESIDVHNDPEGMAQLRALGARSVPVVALGDRYTLCQSFGDVVKFLDLKTRLMDALPPEALVGKLELVLDAAARYVRQFPPGALREEFRNRKRTPASTAFHVFRVAEMGLQAHALMAAAEGAVHAYAHITGDDWKPYEASTPAASTVQRRSADAMRAALED